MFIAAKTQVIIGHSQWHERNKNASGCVVIRK